MLEAIGASTLWAMQPDALGELLKLGSIEAMLPEALKALASFGSGGGAAAAAKTRDQVREGATAIVALRGPLSPRGSYGGTSTDRFADLIHAAGADPDIGVVVLDIMSPGGMVFGTAEAGDAVYAVRQLKPVIAVANPYAFSAAHWIATQASAYYATTSGEVGSAGVRAGHLDMSGFEAMIGMKTTLIASSPEKIAGHPHAPLADADRAEIQASIDEANRMFVAAIARGRGLRPAQVAAIHGEGRTFPAARAAALGVIDGVMTLPDVIANFGRGSTRLGLLQRRAEVRYGTASSTSPNRPTPWRTR